MKKQSIIIPFHRDRDMLMFSLKTLFQTIPDDVEVIVVGNNSNYNEIDFEISDPRCTYYKINDNLFYPGAVNYGVSKSHGDLLTICDPDVFYLANWYEPLKNKLRTTSAGAVSCKLINPCNNRILDFGVYYAKYNAVHSTTGLLHDHPLAGKDRIVQSACSAVLMTTRELFDQVDGMDKDLPFAYTDFDFCLKLYELGHPTIVVADSEVYHKGSTDPDNSKYHSFGYLRSDCKGMFYANDFHRMKLDFYKWFMITYEYFRQRHKGYPRKYFLIDMSTVYSREDYYQVLTDRLDLEFLDRHIIPVKTRNPSNISLHQSVDFDFITLNTPILFFVDTFCSLFNNSLWFKMRNISHDIVIDRHGNILPLDEIAEQRC